MAITYAQTAELMSDSAFQGRTKSACLKYAAYIRGEAPGVPAYNTRQRWSREAFAAPDAAVSAIMPALVWDDRVQSAGAAITDADLQVATETTVNQLF